jgi:hypothetical protein
MYPIWIELKNVILLNRDWTATLTKLNSENLYYDLPKPWLFKRKLWERTMRWILKPGRGQSNQRRSRLKQVNSKRRCERSATNTLEWKDHKRQTGRIFMTDNYYPTPTPRHDVHQFRASKQDQICQLWKEEKRENIPGSSPWRIGPGQTCPEQTRKHKNGKGGLFPPSVPRAHSTLRWMGPLDQRETESRKTDRGID